MAVTDLDEWLRPGVDHDEVTLEVDDATTGLALRASLAITSTGRRVRLDITLDGTRASHDADEPGPPTANWDRMRIGGVEWRMVEPLRRWELTVDDPLAGMRAFLAFTGASPCTDLADGYEQVGSVTGQLQLADHRVTLSDATARRSHMWH